MNALVLCTHLQTLSSVSLSCISCFSTLNSVIHFHWFASLSLSLSHTHSFYYYKFKTIQKKILATYQSHVPEPHSSNGKRKKFQQKRGWEITLQGYVLSSSNIVLVNLQLHVSVTFQILRQHHLWKWFCENYLCLQISFAFYGLEEKKVY